MTSLSKGMVYLATSRIRKTQFLLEKCLNATAFPRLWEGNFQANYYTRARVESDNTCSSRTVPPHPAAHCFKPRTKSDLTGKIRLNAYKLVGGYSFNTNFGVEAGYVNLGKLTEDLGSGVTGTVKGRALYVAGTYTLPVNDQFSVFGKLGITRNSIKASATDGVDTVSEKWNKTSPLIGLGASFAITPKLSVVGEYEKFGKTASEAGVGHMKADLLSVGLRYKF